MELIQLLEESCFGKIRQRMVTNLVVIPGACCGHDHHAGTGKPAGALRVADVANKSDVFQGKCFQSFAFGAVAYDHQGLAQPVKHLHDYIYALIAEQPARNEVKVVIFGQKI